MKLAGAMSLNPVEVPGRLWDKKILHRDVTRGKRLSDSGMLGVAEGPRLKVVRPIRKLRGQTEPWEVEVSDGTHAVMKAMQNPFGGTRLARGLFAALMLKKLSIDVLDTEVAEVTEEFTYQYPMTFDVNGSHQVLRAGRHLITRIPSGVTIWDMFPRSCHEKIRNRDVFARALVADSWLCLRSDPHSVFIKSGERQYKAYQTGRSGVLGGEEWAMDVEPHEALYYDHDMFRKLDVASLTEATAGSIEALSDEDLARMVHAIPSDWLSGHEGEFGWAIERLASSRKGFASRWVGEFRKLVGMPDQE